MTHKLAVAAGALLAAIAANAQDATIDLPAGLACPGYDLRVEIWGNPLQVYREFVDRSGNVVRSITAGKGNTLVFTNLSSGATLSLRPNGSTTRVALQPDGSQAVDSLGHHVLIMFPTDIPAGPSTTQYVGRLAYTVDPLGVFTITKTSGRSVDLCAALTS